ncbi:MAG: L-threonylcarbamoyladenylate synthase [bacterium]|nr:L-threonylcarbamoyladenylate synthase [bacterium]
MVTRLQFIDKNQFDIKELKEAADIIKDGGLVAFPTETVYGLGADGLKEEAAKKIYAAKGRPSDNPLILHIAEVSALEELSAKVPKSAYDLAKKFWPGPLTMILNKSEKVPYGTTGGLETVAIRMPNDEVALALIKMSGAYIAAPSANTSGRPSPTTAKHVMDDLSGKIDMVLDGGQVGIGIESTIVDLTGEYPTILRPGYITKSMLEEVVGEVRFDAAILKENKDKNLKPKAPGMKYKHYAPKGDLTIFEGNMEHIIARINELAAEKIASGQKVGIIATTETSEQYKHGIVKTVGTRADELTVAHGLYAVLREFDDLGVNVIYAESFEEYELGQAIMNRLLKAAGYDMVHIN